MNKESIKIDDIIINLDYIIMIALNAQIYSYKDGEYHSGVEIALAVTSGDLGDLTNAVGSWEPETLRYTGLQAEALRPWLVEMFPCEGRSIQLPEAVEAEEENEPAKAKECFRCGEPIINAVNDNFCSEVCAKIFVDEIPF